MTGSSRAANSTCPAAGASRVYDANGHLDYKLDWNGNKTDYTYDASGKLLDWTVGAGTANALKTVNTWTTFQGRDVISTTTYYGVNGAAVKSVTYGYATGTFVAGNVQTITRKDITTGVTALTTYGYAFYSNGSQQTYSITRSLPTGAAVTTFVYDAFGNIASIQDASGATTSFPSYNHMGYPSTSIDKNGIHTDYTYDAAGHVLTATRHAALGDLLTTYTWNGFGQKLTESHADGSAVQCSMPIRQPTDCRASETP